MSTPTRLALTAAALWLCTFPAVAEPLGLRPSQPQGTQHDTQAESIDWSALNWDASKLSGPSANITAKRSLPSAWDGKAGIDSNVSNQPANIGAPIDPNSLLPGTAKNASDAAWAKVTAPGLDAPVGWDKTSFDARFDPIREERKLGTTLSKSVPLNERLSVTLQNGTSMTQTPTAAQAAPASAAPHTALDTMSHYYSSENTAKLNVLPTSTSLSVGTAMSTTDEKWRRSLGAEQKLFGGLSVKGSVSETATGIPDKSISAGFTRNW